MIEAIRDEARRRRDEARDIARRLQFASLDEVRVVDRLLTRLERRRDRHGPLDLAQWRFDHTEFALSEIAEELVIEDRDRAALHESARVEMLGVEQVVETAWIKPDPPIAGPARFELKRRTPEGRRAYILGLEQTGVISREAAEALLEQPAMPEPELGGEG